jgi:hypothetical protein
MFNISNVNVLSSFRVAHRRQQRNPIAGMALPYSKEPTTPLCRDGRRDPAENPRRRRAPQAVRAPGQGSRHDRRRRRAFHRRRDPNRKQKRFQRGSILTQEFRQPGAERCSTTEAPQHHGSTAEAPGRNFAASVMRGNGAPLAPLFLACVTTRSAVARKALRRAARIWNCPAGSSLVRSGASVVLPWCNSAQLPQPAQTPKYLMD